jgi:exopolyphosphatase / guanosine-5'-triphosphate,3'-diphosphate pyrophosphatase
MGCLHALPLSNMRISSIDIGSNTIMLLVVDDRGDGSLEVIHDEQRIARLGKSVDASKRIVQDGFLRCLGIMRHYCDTSQRYGASQIIATGTSALRDATNTEELISFIHDETGVKIDVISGNEEAALTFKGAISGVVEKDGSFAVIDIGGGSTEVILGSSENIIAAASVDMGSVRMTERFLHESPPSDPDLRQLRAFVGDQIAGFPLFDQATTKVVAVAGTASTLALIDLGLHAFDRSAISGYVLTLERLTRMNVKLAVMSAGDIRLRLAVDPGRADVILAGAIILEEFMHARNISQVTVSDRGLRYGAALQALRV